VLQFPLLLVLLWLLLVLLLVQFALLQSQLTSSDVLVGSSTRPKCLTGCWNSQGTSCRPKQGW
jgi:hypothetical protein